MSDDLIKRLRIGVLPEAGWIELMDEAADALERAERLERENARLLEDAERYRKLAAYADKHWDGTIGRAQYWNLHRASAGGRLRGETFDEAVDALAKEGK